MSETGAATSGSSTGRARGRARLRAALLLAVVLLAAAMAVAATEKDSSLVKILPPVVPTSRTLILRTQVAQGARVGGVTFWVRYGRTIYQPFEARQDEQDGTWWTRLVWQGGTKAVNYFVEVRDVEGQELAMAGGPSEPRLAYFSPESIRIRSEAGPLQWAAAACFLLLCWYLLRWMRRMDRWDRVRRFWLRLLRPLVRLHGRIVIRSIDRLVERAPGYILPGDVPSSRLTLLQWLGEIRAAEGVRISPFAGIRSRRRPPAALRRRRPGARDAGAVRPRPPREVLAQAATVRPQGAAVPSVDSAAIVGRPEPGVRRDDVAAAAPAPAVERREGKVLPLVRSDAVPPAARAPGAGKLGPKARREAAVAASRLRLAAKLEELKRNPSSRRVVRRARAAAG
jgi:hypothetical protein